MPRTLCAAVLVLAVVCVGCGGGVGDQPAAEATPVATTEVGQQPTDSPDLAKEGFDAGESETLEPSQEGEGGSAPDNG
jgi:PBP1b-binding outer membrane lipoprotein LpoB